MLSRVGISLQKAASPNESLHLLLFSRIILLFIAMIFLVFCKVFHANILIQSSYFLGFSLLTASFAFTLAESILVEYLSDSKLVTYFHVLFDITLISVWVDSASGKENLFALIYLIQILVISLILYQNGGYFAAISASIFFALSCFANRQPFWITSWAIYSTLFFALGGVGGYLSEQLKRSNQSLKEKSREIEKLIELHERILHSIPTGLMSLDGNGAITYVNPAGEAILRKTLSEMMGKFLREVEPGLIEFLTKMEKSEFKGVQQTVEIGKTHERKILRGAISELGSESGLSILSKHAGGGEKVFLFQDVTQVARLEEKIKQNDKLAAIGQLAAGIAHEIRNPLASMSGSIQILKSSADSLNKDENHKLMDIVLREIDRLNGLISEFLDYVKPEKMKFETITLQDLLSEIAMTAKQMKEVKGKLTFVEEYAKGTLASGSREKLKQVVWNLILNAIQSMKNNGQITVGCEAVDAEQVMFWVQDEGAGMTEEVKKHLYEPFFTTKDRGTGLGLATAYKIIEAHGGEIRVTSAVDRGTRFEVVLKKA